MERKEAIEIVRSNFPNGRIQLSEALMTLIPELKESEEGNIKKVLIDYFNRYKENTNLFHKISVDKILAWLEKQGEQTSIWSEEDKGFLDLLLAIFTNEHPNGLFTTNGITVFNGDYVSSGRIVTWLQSFKTKCKVPVKDDETLLEKQGKLETNMDEQETDNVEPKFKVGDWIIGRVTDNEPLQISKNTDQYYEFTCGDQYSLSFENEMHLWTIDDAKDGDVLAFYFEHKGNKMEQVGIIKKYVGRHGGCSNSFNIYVGLNWENNLQIGEYMGSNDIQPATKEQREILFSKMKEAGYEWDNENKLLRKQCEQNLINNVKPKFKIGDWIICNGLHPALILDIVDKEYEIEFTDDGSKGSHPIDLIERHCHLWTIYDAKDGDVLVYKEQLFLFKRMNTSNSFYAHCNYHFIGYDSLNVSDCSYSTDSIYPATKEQRDLLFQKMKENGYEWDAEKKELISIENKS